MNNSQRYLITKMAGLAERPNPRRFIKGANVGNNFVQDFIDGAKQNPRLGFIQSSNDGTMHKVAALEGAMGAVKNFLGEPHGQDLASLGLLAIPAVHHMITGKDKTDKAMGAAELAGLGGLAVPGIQHFRGK